MSIFFNTPFDNIEVTVKTTDLKTLSPLTAIVHAKGVHFEINENDCSFVLLSEDNKHLSQTELDSIVSYIRTFSNVISIRFIR